jgi:predicted DCC family thiol-disulfide oxidoreductase YuxK
MTLYPVVRFTVRGADVEGLRCTDCYTVIYDGACVVCGRLVAALRRIDRRGTLEFVTSQAPGIGARFPWIPARAFAESVQFVEPDGTTWQGARAVEEILAVLPVVRPFSWLFRIPFARPLADRLYRWFARNRYRLGCGEHCQFRASDLDFGDEVGLRA